MAARPEPTSHIDSTTGTPTETTKTDNNKLVVAVPGAEKPSRTFQTVPVHDSDVQDALCQLSLPERQVYERVLEVVPELVRQESPLTAPILCPSWKKSKVMKTTAFRGLPFGILAALLISTVYSLDCRAPLGYPISCGQASLCSLASKEQRRSESYGKSTSSLVLFLSTTNDYADTAREVVSAVRSRQEDLQQTLALIRQHWTLQEQDPYDAAQQALLEQALRYQQQDAQRRKAQRVELYHRALLTTQFSLQNLVKQRQAKQRDRLKEANQRNLLQAALQFQKVSSSWSESTAIPTKEPTTPIQIQTQQRIAEAKQRALLEAQLSYGSTKEKSLTSTSPNKVPPTALDNIRHFLLEEQPEYKDALIRIACATCPSDAVFPRHVTEIEILALSTSNQSSILEVAILVCDPKQGDCVNVAVPITFSPSFNENDEAWLNHMIQQLQQLDQQALYKLQTCRT